MKELRIIDLFNVTQISRSNDRIWKELEETTRNTKEPILLDFEDINLEEPYNNNYFLKILANPKIYFKIYSDEKLKNEIELICKLGVMDTGRVFNEDFEYEDNGPDLSEIRILNKINKMKEYTSINGNTVLIDLSAGFNQLSDNDTAKSIKKLIEELIEKGIVKIDINIQNCYVQSNMIEKLAALGTNFREKGIEVDFKTDDLELLKEMMLYKFSIPISSSTKINLFEGIEINTVGIISKFKSTRRKDRYGRSGDGEPLITRVAIFKGIEKGIVHLWTFNGNFFKTKQDYYLDENEELNFPKIDKWDIPIGQIGLADEFLGSMYHFNYPIQLSKNDNISTHRISICEETGKTSIKYDSIPLPEYIKLVLDDFEIMYNVKALEEAIIETHKYLE